MAQPRLQLGCSPEHWTRLEVHNRVHPPPQPDMRELLGWDAQGSKKEGCID